MNKLAMIYCAHCGKPWRDHYRIAGYDPFCDSAMTKPFKFPPCKRCRRSYELHEGNGSPFQMHCPIGTSGGGSYVPSVPINAHGRRYSLRADRRIRRSVHQALGGSSKQTLKFHCEGCGRGMKAGEGTKDPKSKMLLCPKCEERVHKARLRAAKGNFSGDPSKKRGSAKVREALKQLTPVQRARFERRVKVFMRATGKPLRASTLLYIIRRSKEDPQARREKWKKFLLNRRNRMANELERMARFLVANGKNFRRPNGELDYMALAKVFRFYEHLKWKDRSEARKNAHSVYVLQKGMRGRHPEPGHESSEVLRLARHMQGLAPRISPEMLTDDFLDALANLEAVTRILEAERREEEEARNVYGGSYGPSYDGDPRRRKGLAARRHKKPSDFPAAVLARGTRAEMREHGVSARMARRIAMDHLTENPNAYKRKS